MSSFEETLGERVFFFLSGIVVGVPVALFFESLSHLWFTTLGVATIVAPFVEEFAKANALFFRYGRSGKSLMRLGLLSGLGFGVAEFLVYVFHGVPFLKRLPALGFHAAGTSIVGYGVYRRKTYKYYLLAVALHSINNFFTGFGPLRWLWAVFGVGATFTSYLLAFSFYDEIPSN